MISLGIAFALSHFHLDDAYLDKIEASDLKRIVSFLASDELKGRNTPSPGLDMAADFIASEFKKSGVKPGNGDSYFQIAEWTRGKKADQKEMGATVRNVIGIIPGTDPNLAKQYVVVSGHYDHLGEQRLTDTNANADRIYNGANDDGSGTAGVVEIARALAGEKPRRTIILVTWFGEEKGLIGSTYYVNHPIFPLKDTVANINLEQIGRTDDLEGPRVNAGSLTGFNFSSIGTTFAAVGKKMGTEISGHPTSSASFFGRSDNVSFARFGIPAHTLCTAFEYPDYHKVSDHFDKLDYENMAKIVKVSAATLLEIANADGKPTWNKDEPGATRYIAAAAKLAGG
ncbi:MAG: M28 family peptidase [Armatimonadota bacterium]